jgi:hypothetical protein
MINGLVEKRVCKKCGVEKDLNDFYVRYKGGQSFYLKKCNECNNAPKKVYSFTEVKDIDKDIKSFIECVNKQGGWINEVEAFKLVSLYVDKFGIKCYDRLSIEDELCLMWEELKGV